MIITVTMNPAIDKTIELNTFVHGDLNRIQKVILDAGGKGINVSKTIRALGGESLATGFLGGRNGDYIQEVLRKFSIKTDFVKIEEETRVNTKIAETTGLVTELNEKGPVIDLQAMSELLMKLMNCLKTDSLLVLSGSVPLGVPKSIYRLLTELAHEMGAKVLVDADGDLFAEALSVKPDIVKPNQSELEKYFGYAMDSDEKIVEAGKKLLEKGVKIVIISLGAEGAYFIDKEHTLYSPALSVQVNSTVGAGDAMVAAFSYGVDQGLSFEETAKLAMATSVGAVTTVGTKPPTIEVVKGLLDQVTVVKKFLKD